ncbi:hypothetical protein CVT25_014986 [Psilocybe cyanescens]|uniref:Uncharacterized protein n=1 Tax=Psilocybe cyanescens TaxID=93625 RepID=A0A409XI92_PSICY|nr:hypothetical protein CVT25_014986 [Psilocybe cyanescens]
MAQPREAPSNTGGSVRLRFEWRSIRSPGESLTKGTLDEGIGGDTGLCRLSIGLVEKGAMVRVESKEAIVTVFTTSCVSRGHGVDLEPPHVIQLLSSFLNMADMDVFAAMGIAGFGKTIQKKELDPSRFDKNKRGDKAPQPAGKSAAGPAPGPSSLSQTKDGESNDGDDDDNEEQGPAPPVSETKGGQTEPEEPEFEPSGGEEDEEDLPQFPITHEITLKDHSKVVSALALDPSGARIISGSYDCDCKLWDFGGMDMRCKPFKSWEPAGTYYVNDLKYSNDGSKFLCLSGTTQAKLFDRDGEEQATFVKGDPYIRDMKNTSGHVGELTSCAWHPKDPKLFITSSADSTIRIWEVENKRKQKSVIVVKSKERGARTKVTACNYSPDGNLIGGVWDLRSFKKPLAVHSGLSTLYPSTNAVFSPDDKYVITGAGATSKGGQGRLVILNKDGLEEVKSLAVDATPVKVAWHSKINQIVTGLSNGQIVVLYSPVTSLNGAKLLLSKGPPRKVTIEDVSDALSAPTILTPHALPMFRDLDAGRGTKRKREKDRMDPRKSKRPELPVTGPGKGGRVGASATQHVVQNLVRDTTRDVDPREALLRYADDKDPQWTKDSPATPVDNSVAPDVKIDMDYADNEQESDVRHEPLPVKELDAPISIHGTADVVMGDSHIPAATPGISADFSMASIDHPATNGNGSSTRSYHDDSDNEHDEPPAKRARVHSDADMASMTHSATPPPVSHAPTPPPPPTTVPPPPTTNASSSTSQPPPPTRECTLTPQQYRYIGSTLRTLRKLKDGIPFLRPVDPIALNVPHYPSIIKTPMDISTIERKLFASNPSRPDSNPHNPRYYDAEDVTADVRLMVQNAITFNGPDHLVSEMAKRILEIYEKAIKHLPPRIEKPAPKPAVVRKATTPPAPVAPTPVANKKNLPAPRRASTSVPVIRRSDAEAVGRPKREIHPPPPKDLPYADAPKKNRKGKKTKPDGTSEQLKYCNKILQELNRKQYAGFAYPFYEPVDWQKLEIPSYPKIIKKPMDLSTIRKKLDGGEYETAQSFYDDFKLMIRNCFTFNPSGTPVNLAGQELQRLFDDKWKSLPPLQPQDASDDEEEDEEDSDEERRRAIAMMESQIETMKNNIESLKTAKAPKEKKKEKKKEKAPVASTSKPPPKQPKAPSKKKTKKNVTDDDVLTFEQKKDLSESIGKLDGARLERVIQIIHEGVPEIRDSTEEIELEIDQLPAAVLTKLYNFVLRPMRQPAQPKRNRTGKGTGTGGLRRKSMDEEKEAEKIRQLEERMALFEPHGATSAAPARRNDESEHSSDSSSGSDSSGSDSE